jgi:hypothetical protein
MSNSPHVFSLDEITVKVPGFYDGDGDYRIRFSPPHKENGVIKPKAMKMGFQVKMGNLFAFRQKGNNHGPVKIVNTFYLEYADGTPFYSTGTTAYQWTSVKQEIQEKTLQTLASSPFNKMRMCVFPKHYQYGNETEPWNYPFQRKTH